MPTLDRASQVFAVFAEAPIAIRVVLFFLVWVAIWLPIAIPLAIVLKWRPFKPLETQQKLPLVISLYLVAPLVLWAAAWVQHRSFAGYGLVWNSNLLRSLGWGFALGASGLALLFVVQTRLGWAELQPQNWQRLAGVMPLTLLLSLLIAGIEELIFRGFFFNQLLGEFDFWTAAIASSLVFALLHLVWEGQKNIPQLPGLSLMGVVLCLAIAADGSIGLAWGLHAGWVWTMASLDSAQLVEPAHQAPEWLVGADGQPLAGVIGLLFLLATGLLLLPLGKI